MVHNANNYVTVLSTVEWNICHRCDKWTSLLPPKLNVASFPSRWSFPLHTFPTASDVKPGWVLGMRLGWINTADYLLIQQAIHISYLPRISMLVLWRNYTWSSQTYIGTYFEQSAEAVCTQQLHHCHPKSCHRLFPIVHFGKSPLVPHTELILQQSWFVHHSIQLWQHKQSNSKTIQNVLSSALG